MGDDRNSYGKFKYSTDEEFRHIVKGVEERGLAGFMYRNQTGEVWIYGYTKPKENRRRFAKESRRRRRQFEDQRPSKAEHLSPTDKGSGFSFALCKDCARVKEYAKTMGAAPVCHDFGSEDNPSRTAYVYRSQSDNEYSFSNVNAGDIAGVLLYLHHEVVMYCPRRNHITRILRKKVTFAPK